MREEPMTGWDSPDDLPTDIDRAAQRPGLQFLRALWDYVTMETRTDPNVSAARQKLLQSLYSINWDLVGWTLKAHAAGDDIFSAHPNNDVLLKYKPQDERDPDQHEIAF